jgi:hypothetical protein
MGVRASYSSRSKKPRSNSRVRVGELREPKGHLFFQTEMADSKTLHRYIVVCVSRILAQEFTCARLSHVRVNPR